MTSMNYIQLDPENDPQCLKVSERVGRRLENPSIMTSGDH